jgi:hypothetical protein
MARLLGSKSEDTHSPIDGCAMHNSLGLSAGSSTVGCPLWKHASGVSNLETIRHIQKEIAVRTHLFPTVDAAMNAALEGPSGAELMALANVFTSDCPGEDFRYKGGELPGIPRVLRGQESAVENITAECKPQSLESDSDDVPKILQR